MTIQRLELNKVAVEVDVLDCMPVKRAWVADSVPRCDYCHSGQIIAAAVPLAQKPAPTEGDVDPTMGRVLCRCGTYQRIRRAIHRAARGR